MPTPEEINAHYKTTFNANFAKLSAGQLSDFDAVVGAANQPPVVIVNGQVQENPQFVAFKKHLADQGSPQEQREYLKNLGVYASWRAGIVPQPGQGAISEATKQKALGAGVPLEKLESTEADRKAQWANGVLGRFATLAPPPEDAVKANEAAIKVDDVASRQKALENPEAKKTKPVLEMPAEEVSATPPPAAPNASKFVAGSPEGLKERGNIDIANRPEVQNGDGSVSTVRSMGVNIDGKEVLIPTVHSDGHVMDEKQAIEHYKKTGEHLGVFDSPEASNKYAQALHEEQAASGREPTKKVPFTGPISPPPQDDPNYMFWRNQNAQGGS